MTPGHMTEEEYQAFKEKTKFREPQVVKTFYEENLQETEGLKHHAERRALNRTLRFQQSNLLGKLKYVIQSLKEIQYVREIEWAMTGRN